MLSNLVILLLVIGCFNTIDSRHIRSERSVGHLWDKLRDKTIKHSNIDDRRLDKEGTLLFPDVAFQSPINNNTWKLIVHGWRYQSHQKKSWLELSANLWIERLTHELSGDQNILQPNGSINYDRLRPFFYSNEYNDIMNIQIGNQTHQLHTDHSGQFYEPIEISNEQLELLKTEQQSDNLLNYTATGDDGEKVTGSIHLIEPNEELSIISDIDDTIKISEVLDKVRLLLNTFIYPFKPVPGMAELYQQWSLNNKNCTFHYLSAMPDQLFSITEEFIREQRFPPGSFHMRHFSWTITALFDFVHSQSTFNHKMSYLHFFLNNTRRQFILVGDSGEKDPEIYGTIAREYPQRIRAIFIRAIKNESIQDQRFLDAFHDVNEEKWMIFNDPKQVPVDLSHSPRKATH